MKLETVHENLGSAIDSISAGNATQPFAIFSDGKQLTFGEMDFLSNGLAHKLVETGISTGSKVALLSDNNKEACIAFTACWKIGALVFPVDIFLSQEQIWRLINDAEVESVLYDPGSLQEDVLEMISSKDRSWTAIQLLTSDVIGSKTYPNNSIDEKTPGVCIFTSGSTGNPKGVVLTHGNLIFGADNVISVTGVSQRDRVLCVLPFSHLNGLITTFLAPLLSGSSAVYMTGPFFPHKAAFLIDQFECTWLSAIPTHYNMLMHPRLDKTLWSFKSLRFCRSASAPLLPKLIRDFEEYYGIPIIESMGMTETSAQIFSNPLPPGIRKPGSVGLPYGFEVRIVNNDGAVCADGEDGEIQIKGPGLMAGYLNAPDETKKAYSGEWLKSGDIGTRDADGYYFIKGRIKDICIFNGINISLRQLESEILTKGIVFDVACIAEEHTFFTENIIIFAIPLKGTVKRSHIKNISDSIFSTVRPYLPSRLAVKEIRFVKQFPRTHTGKILKDKLKDMPVLMADGIIEHYPDLRKILADVLGIFEEAITEDFDQSKTDHWDSLAHTTLILTLEKILGRELCSEEILNLSSYQGILEVLEKNCN